MTPNQRLAVLFDYELLQQLRDQTTAFWRMSWVYRSNWRVLHVDGFEGGRRLPIGAGKFIQLFHYETSPDPRAEPFEQIDLSAIPVVTPETHPGPWPGFRIKKK